MILRCCSSSVQCNTTTHCRYLKAFLILTALLTQLFRVPYMLHFWPRKVFISREMWSWSWKILTLPTGMYAWLIRLLCIQHTHHVTSVYHDSYSLWQVGQYPSNFWGVLVLSSALSFLTLYGHLSFWLSKLLNLLCCYWLQFPIHTYI